MEFVVGGRPFFPIGGQSHNSSAYNGDEIASAIAGVRALGGNTLEAPVYWEQLEPEEGRFDFAAVDAILQACRNADLKWIVLWFGTWKNGEMRYVPEWVKSDTSRFPRVVGYEGTELPVLSSYAEATRAADARAFTELCIHLSRADGGQHTVIAVQVENEPGILGSDRDYGQAAGKALDETVPGVILDLVSARHVGPVYEAWVANGAKRGAPWLETFGDHGYEYREAWSIASFIDFVASEGQKHFSRPMYTNAWLGGDSWQVPGVYPCGGPVAAVLDIWKPATPHLATIAPDIYIANPVRYRGVCEGFAREDNPLFVPESSANDANASNMLTAIADFGAVGYACFAVDSVIDLDGRLRPGAVAFAGSVASAKAMIPLIQKFRGTGRIHAVIQDRDAAGQFLRFTRYQGVVPYDPGEHLGWVTDHRHARAPGGREPGPCYGLIVEAEPYEFYLAGQFHLHLVPGGPPGWLGALRNTTAATPPDYLSVEEGMLLEDGSFRPRRKRNGDEVVFGGFWTAPDVGVVRVRLTPQEKNGRRT